MVILHSNFIKMADNNTSFFRQTPPVTLNLLIINTIFWVASIFLPEKFGVNLTDLLGLHYFLAEKFHVYQLFTYMFMHNTSSFAHLFFNMFGVWMLGRILENVWGSKQFLLYYMVAGIGAAIVQELCWMADFSTIANALNAGIAQNSGEPLLAIEQELSHYFSFSNLQAANAVQILEIKNTLFNMPITVGASGALFGILLAFGWLFPEERLFLMFIPIPIKARIFVAIYAVAELFLGVADFSGDSIAHFAHLGGMIFGLIVLLIWKKQGKLYG